MTHNLTLVEVKLLTSTWLCSQVSFTVLSCPAQFVFNRTCLHRPLIPFIAVLSTTKCTRGINSNSSKRAQVYNKLKAQHVTCKYKLYSSFVTNLHIWLYTSWSLLSGYCLSCISSLWINTHISRHRAATFLYFRIKCEQAPQNLNVLCWQVHGF